MTIKNLLLCVAVLSFGVVQSAPATANVADAVTEIATQSRHLADAGQWDDARTVLENKLSQLKDLTQIARIKAELAHYAVERNTYFQKDAEIEPARASFRDSLKLRQRNDMKVFVPFAMILLADFEGGQKYSAEAIHYAEQAIQLAKSGNSPRALYAAQSSLAKLYVENGKTLEGRLLAEQSRAKAETFGSLI